MNRIVVKECISRGEKGEILQAAKRTPRCEMLWQNIFLLEIKPLTNTPSQKTEGIYRYHLPVNDYVIPMMLSLAISKGRALEKRNH